jgi:hypothetical protein
LRNTWGEDKMNPLFSPIQYNNIDRLTNSLEDLYELKRDSVLFQNYINYQLILHRIMQELDSSVYSVFENKKKTSIPDKDVLRKLARLIYDT